jgi:hypothetical protein
MRKEIALLLALTCVLLMGVISASAIAQVDGGKSAVPSEPGMYAQLGSTYTKIIGQIAEFTRTGSRLVSHATIGIKASKANIQLPGPHAQTVVSPQPVFYFIPPKQEAAAGVNAGDFILIRLEEKSQRRQFEVAAAGLFRASSGISLTHQVQILRSEPSPGVYMITPAVELSKGEYALYLARGEGMAAYVYDFGVQGRLATQPLLASSQRPNDATSRFAAQSSAGGENNQPDTSARVSAGQPRSPAPNTSTPSGRSAEPGPAGRTSVSNGGVLGVNGADWSQGGFTGVEIVEVSDDSSAQLAGLHKGNVITDINGTHVHSTDELARVLAQLGPGTRINIAYLYKSNLGWMPQETTAILGKAD